MSCHKRRVLRLFQLVLLFEGTFLSRSFVDEHVAWGPTVDLFFFSEDCRLVEAINAELLELLRVWLVVKARLLKET